ncbi:condensation domain-containing protein, partial [Streptomyces antimicrobicus]
RPELVARPRPAELPASFAQQRLWFLDRLEGASATYNLPVAFTVSGRVDARALELALGDVVARHESLRTVFAEAADGGRATQVILPPQPFVLNRVACSPQEHAEAVRAAAGHVFDLAVDLPLRATLVSTGEEEHVLLLLLHHIAGDGASMGPLTRDLGEAYAARLGGEAPSWAPLAVQYADYTLWQQRLLGEEGDPG